MTLPTRRCMVCREDRLKGFFKHRTDPICIDCTEDVKAQRKLLTEKYRIQFRDQQAAKRRAMREDKQAVA